MENWRYAQQSEADICYTQTYCDVPGSPCLSKMGSVYGPLFFLKFWVPIARLVLSVNGPKDPWSRVLSLPGVGGGGSIILDIGEDPFKIITIG